MTEDHSCKIVYHLVGEQAIPVFLTAIQFPENTKHILLTTYVGKTKQTVENISSTLQGKGRIVEIQYLGGEKIAVSFPDLIPRMREILAKTNPDHLTAGFDITGGTKPMSISLMLMAKEQNNSNLFYLDSRGRKLLCLTDDSQSRELNNTMILEDFIHLSGMQLKSSCTQCVSPAFLDYLYKNVKRIQKYQADFASCLPKQKTGNKEQLFQTTYSKFRQEMGETEWDRRVQELNEPNGKTPSWQNLAKFLAGEWFEQYLFAALKKSGKEIKDIRRNAVLSFAGENNRQAAQEFDVVYTDGYSLILLECKAGRVLQEHFNKLENLRGKYSGALGKSAIVTLNPSNTKNGQKEFFNKRINTSSGVAAFCGKSGIRMISENPFDFETGIIYECWKTGHRNPSPI